MGRLRTANQKKLKPEEQFGTVDDFKLRMTISALADRYDEMAREEIKRVYNDDQLMSLYRGIRASGIYQTPNKNYRKIFSLPSMLIWDFLNTVLTNLYGPNWLNNNKAVSHELVRPFWVIDRL